MIDPYDLVQAHRYAEAISLCNQRLSVDENDVGALANMASALRATGSLQKAIEFFRRVEEVTRGQLKGDPGQGIDIACLYWCMGEHAKGIALMHDMVQGILDRRILYGDQGGGVTQGLLLMYMAVTVDDTKEKTYAVRYLKKKSKMKSRGGRWPNPISRLYLDEASFEDVLEAATGKRAEADAVLRSQEDKSLVDLCQTFFHFGVKKRIAGSEKECLDYMVKCLNLPPSPRQVEGYLAKYEINKAQYCQSEMASGSIH
jgi:tetratricopeptide (TPR) repeat protein